MEHKEPEGKSQSLFIRWVQQFRRRGLVNKFGWLAGWLAEAVISMLQHQVLGISKASILSDCRMYCQRRKKKQCT
jgi:hypothetical protein